MDNLYIFVSACILISLYMITIKASKKSIENYVYQMGGKLVNIERSEEFPVDGPFKYTGKGRMIYKFEYRLNDTVKTGYVRFDMFGGNGQWKV